MRLQIGSSAAKPTDDDVVDSLLACHARIRNFCGLAGRLATAVDSPRSEIAEAARAVNRYFTIALPLHVADEDVSLRPRLERVAPALAEALARMTSEHAAIEQVLADAAPRWRTIAAEPGRHAELTIALARDAKRLDELFAPHLRAEETLLFPELPRLLDADELRTVRGELRARRA
jgi:hemerythrin-like domain-containing protein